MPATDDDVRHRLRRLPGWRSVPVRSRRNRSAITGLTPATGYGFTVKAMDAQGNMSDGLTVGVTTGTDFTDDDFSIFEDDIEWLSSAGSPEAATHPQTIGTVQRTR